MIFYDFEVFKYDWLVVFKNTDDRKTTTIVNDVEQLRKFHENNVEQVFVGFNSRSYDRWIFKCILAGLNPKELNDYIIKERKPAWTWCRSLWKIPLINYDAMINMGKGLKRLEGFMGHDIRETTVPFDIDRKLTKKEIEEVIFYCNHDVEELMEVFIRDLAEWEAHIGLIKNFKLPITNLSKTKAQLSAKILGAEQPVIPRDDEFDITIVPNVRLKKYKYIQDWYIKTRDKVQKNPKLKEELMTNEKAKKQFYKEHYLECEIADVSHKFGWGGVHGARKNYFGKGFLVNSDVGSFYPSEMIVYKFLSRNVKNPKLYEDIYKHRMKLKKEGKKKEQQPFKIVLNATYGASKDKYNGLYDPLQANNVCINGQLLLLTLIEMIIEEIPEAKLIQTNTDGVLWELPNKSYFSHYKDICNRWCKLTGMTLEHDKIKTIVQKDVNNYYIIMEGKEGDKVKSKGAYLKPLDHNDYELPVVRKAVMEYFTNGTLPEDYIKNCNDLIEYQMICNCSNKYLYALHGDERLDERVLRVFASRKKGAKGVYKMKKVTKDGVDIYSKHKMEGTPTKCFIDNSNIVGKKCPRKLNKKWYVEQCWYRINRIKGKKIS